MIRLFDTIYSWKPSPGCKLVVHRCNTYLVCILVINLINGHPFPQLAENTFFYFSFAKWLLKVYKFIWPRFSFNLSRNSCVDWHGCADKSCWAPTRYLFRRGNDISFHKLLYYLFLSKMMKDGDAPKFLELVIGSAVVERVQFLNKWGCHSLLTCFVLVSSTSGIWL